MMNVSEFVERVMDMEFEDRGRSYERGDCWAIVWLFYRDVLGVDLPSYDTQYLSAGKTKREREEIGAIMEREKLAWIGVDKPQRGDVVNLRCGGRACHVGVMLDGDRFVHIERRQGVMVERLASSLWAKRKDGVYRLAS